MEPRERWLAVLRREKLDRLPMDFWGTNEATLKLMRHLGCSDEWEVYRRLHIDRVVTVGPRYVGPAQFDTPMNAALTIGPEVPGPPPAPSTDMFGCGYQIADYGEGVYSECIYHPLAQFNSVEEIEEK